MVGTFRGILDIHISQTNSESNRISSLLAAETEAIACRHDSWAADYRSRGPEFEQYARNCEAVAKRLRGTQA